MASASAAAIARSLVNNPQFKGMVMNVARGGVKAVGRSRARRARRGRYYVGKRMGIPPNRGYSAQVTTRRLPASIDQTTANKSTQNVVRKSEALNVDIDCEVGDNGALYNWAITPTNTVLFPILSGIAKNYTRYQFKTLVFRYVSSSSTANDGNICLAFDFQAHSNDGDFPNTGVIQSLPSSTTGPIRQPLTLVIPKTLGPNGGPRYIAIPEGQTGDPLSYYAGQLVVACFGANKDKVGQLFVDYECILSNPKVDLEPKVAVFEAVAGRIISRGQHQLELKDDLLRFHSNVPCMLHCDQYTASTAMTGYPVVELGGVPITAYRQFAADPDVNNLARFVIPAHHYGEDLEITPNVNAQSCMCYLTEHVDLA